MRTNKKRDPLRPVQSSFYFFPHWIWINVITGSPLLLSTSSLRYSLCRGITRKLKLVAYETKNKANDRCKDERCGLHGTVQLDRVRHSAIWIRECSRNVIDFSASASHPLRSCGKAKKINTKFRTTLTTIFPIVSFQRLTRKRNWRDRLHKRKIPVRCVLTDC